MKVKIYISFIILLIIPSFLVAQEPTWLVRLKQQRWMDKVKELQVLKTTRTEAEKILEEPKKYNFETADFIQSYTLNTGEVTLSYTTKECSSNIDKIAKDTLNTGQK